MNALRLSGSVLALLVRYRARGLAGGLAGSLALAAAAVGRSLLQGGRGQRGYMLHGCSLLLFRVAVLFFSAHIDAGKSAERRGRQHTKQAGRHAYRINWLRLQQHTHNQQNQKNHKARA